MLDRPVCPCGNRDIAVTYEAHRALLDVHANKIFAPLTVTCLNGHEREIWVEHHEAVGIVQAVAVMG